MPVRPSAPTPALHRAAVPALLAACVLGVTLVAMAGRAPSPAGAAAAGVRPKRTRFVYSCRPTGPSAPSTRPPSRPR